MSVSYQPLSEIKWFGRGLSVVALWVGMILFVVPRINILFHFIQRWPAILEKIIGLFGGLLGIPIFLVYITVASSSAVYFLLCAFVMVGSIYGLTQRNWGWFTKVMLLLVLTSVLWFMFAPYTTTVQPTDGHQMIIVTTPPFLLRGFKRSQSIAEAKSCRYNVLGWQTNQLYYQATCGKEVTQWQFDMDTSARPVPIKGDLPSELYSKTLPQEKTWKLFKLEGIYPPEAEAGSRGVYVQSAGVVSPDGSAVAIVSNNIYSAEDVLIIK